VHSLAALTYGGILSSLGFPDYTAQHVEAKIHGTKGNQMPCPEIISQIFSIAFFP
jgi:hypothetical protein